MKTKNLLMMMMLFFSISIFAQSADDKKVISDAQQAKAAFLEANPKLQRYFDDAKAYASWLSIREKHRYRLPSADEARAQGGSPIPGWLNECEDKSCSRRMISGKPRLLKANRGYIDVGIRLVRAD